MTNYSSSGPPGVPFNNQAKASTPTLTTNSALMAGQIFECASREQDALSRFGFAMSLPPIYSILPISMAFLATHMARS